MRHLYLMRHAKAKSSRADQADHRRPLRRRGRHQAEAMAAPLKLWGALEGDIHVSSARRTLQTLEAVDSVLPGLGVADRVQLHDDLYTFEGQALRGLDSRRLDTVLAERIAGHDRERAALSVASPDEAFHDLRKGVKRIRYLAELDPKRHRRLLKGLKCRQGLLGDFQDLCTRQAWVEAFAAASRHAPRRRQECDAWCADLEEQKRDQREQIIALAPLAS